MSRLLFTSFFVFLMCTRSVAEPLLIVTEELAGFQDVEQGRLVGGATGELMLKAVAQVGLLEPIKVLPWSRAYDLAKLRANVLIFSLVRTKEREAEFVWIKKLVSVSTYAFALKRRRVKGNTMEALSQHVLAVKRNDVIHELLLTRGFREGQNLAPVLSSEAAVALLLAGRADVHPSSYFLMKSECRKLGCELEDFEALFELPQFRLDFYLAANRLTDPKWIDAFRRALKEVQQGSPHLL